MKKYTLLLTLCFLFALQQAYAQPTFYFSPSQVVADQGDQACISLKVRDFTSIITVRFSVTWDPGVVSNPVVSNLNPNLPGLDMSDFTINQTNGTLVFNWTNGQQCNLPTSFGNNLSDDATLFTICFTATGIYGNHTPVQIGDFPQGSYITRHNANCNDIGQFIEDGFISIGTPPLTVNISSGDGFTDDQVCLSFKVEDFDEMLTMQFPIKWDPAILQFVQATTMNLAGFNQSNLGLSNVALGILPVSWNASQSNQCVSLPDGTQILQVCFKIIGTCGQSSDIFIEPNTDPYAIIENVNCNSVNGGLGTNIGLLQQQGKVTVNCFNPQGITMNIDDKDVCPGETFTVDVKVQNFQDISELLFNLEWNPDIIKMVNPRVTFPTNNPCSNLTSALDFSNVNQGRLEMDKSFGIACDLTSNFTLMRLHFQAVGAGGSNSTIAVVNPIYVERQGPPVENIGINNNNGLVTLCDLDNPTLAIGSKTADPGEVFCVPVTVFDFKDITRMQYSIFWDKSILEFVGVQDFALPGLGAANFNTTQALSLGALGFEWEDPSGVDKTDGSIIYNLCFKAVGSPTQCTDISIGSVPYPILVETEQSNGTDVGLNAQAGITCLENPLAFVTTIPEVFGGPNGKVCLDVSVQNFLSLTNMEYSVNWDQTSLQFDSIHVTGALPGFTSSSYNSSPALVQNGELTIDWASTNQILGTSLPDGTSIFQLCFTIIGDPNTCSSINITNHPENIVITTASTGSVNLGMTSDAGQVCVSGQLILTQFTITDVPCPESPTGAISLTVIGGSGDYVYNWSGTGVMQGVEDQTGLSAGDYAVTIADSQNPGIFLTRSFEVNLTPDAPVASAGRDTVYSCNQIPSSIVLDGSGSSSGANFTYFWTNSTPFGLVKPGDETSMNPQVFGGRCFLLTVTNTLTGCTATDEICVGAPVIPFTDGGMGDTITCVKDTVMLDASNSSSFGFQVSWTTDPGGQIVPGTETELQALVTAPGTYYVKLYNLSTQCESSDTVVVDGDLAEPIANAGADTTLGCVDVSVPVDGGGSSAGADFSYEWNPLNGGEVCGFLYAPQTEVCAPGTYQLLVTNTRNGCTATDVVEVQSDTLKPVIQAGPDKILNCFTATVSLEGTATSASGAFSVLWTTANGQIIGDPGILTPQAGQPGLYELAVTDVINGCTSYAQVNVTEEKDLPTVVATADAGITCSDPDAVIDGTGSSTGAIFSYAWQNDAGTVVTNELVHTVTMAGDYTLIVTNNENGCSSSLEVTVAQALPPAANAGMDKSIGCTTPPVLEGAADVNNPDLVIQWQGPGAGCLSNPNIINPTATCPGLYILSVYNTATDCFGQDTVLVIDNMEPPFANAGPDDTLNCIVSLVTLQGSAAPNTTTFWFSPDPNAVIDDPASLTPTVNTAAIYILEVTGENGCVAQDTVAVDEIFEKPTADAGENGQTDCINATATISAAGSTLTGTLITWSGPGIDASNEHDVEVSVGPGTYQLKVEYISTGCFEFAQVTVEDKSHKPAVTAGNDLAFGCEDTSVALDGTGSATGADITYTWTNEAGQAVGNDISTTVSAPGTYTLTVFNTTSNCENSDAVVVSQVSNGEPANAQADTDGCSVEAMLVGNLPAGAAGVWTSLAGGNIVNPNEATTVVNGLLAGENTFVWTLTLGTCVNYSSDTVSIQIDQSAPVANLDQAILTPDLGGSISLNALENDEFGQVTFSILNQPQFGDFSSTDDGRVIFTKEKCLAGLIEIPYEICNVGCPDLCDKSFIRINIEEDPEENCEEVPNGITPNGDGVNDELVFDVLLSSPSEFPDNEIVVFNRWGDVVYKASPYLNDWRGTNQEGKALPHGTYYYIFRLNVANGDIIRGDVTILK
jgi:gliding motility-associated-like protein